jgi:hypothetical protein
MWTTLTPIAYCLPLFFYVGILGIPLSALMSSSFYAPLQLLCKGRLDGLLFLYIPRDLNFFFFFSKQVRDCMLNGQDVLLWLDVQRATTVHKLLGQDVVFIFMVAKSEMALVKWLVERKIESFGNVVCNCYFVICTVKYTHTCVLGMRFKLIFMNIHTPHKICW